MSDTETEVLQREEEIALDCMISIITAMDPIHTHILQWPFRRAFTAGASQAGRGGLDVGVKPWVGDGSLCEGWRVT